MFGGGRRVAALALVHPELPRPVYSQRCLANIAGPIRETHEQRTAIEILWIVDAPP